MNRDEILRELSSLRYDNKLVYNEKGAGTLKKLKGLSDEYLIQYYNAYHSKAYNTNSSEFKYDTFNNYRSKIIALLIYCQTKGIYLENFSQANLNEYSKSINSAGALSVVNAAIPKFLEHFSVNLDYSVILERKKELKSKEINEQPLTSKEIEQIRDFYKNDYFKLFVFEWFYTLELSKEDFEKFSIKDFNYYNKTIDLNNKIKIIPDYICELINNDEVKKKIGRTGKTFVEHLGKMASELHDHKMIKSRFRPMDIEATTKREVEKLGTYNYCPECGRAYESIAENWVIKQYENSDTKWIVCKAVCGKVDEK